ncbi:MAG: sodium:pantothenate symporter [Rhodospirillaceae bacterium]|nr:sodium:pantothenate symporter [Rhodospirillaceae bacterium]|tara:strand:- start:608 stop:2170 length:1563 start_codon:yes stop_codon:yes gene_type:complete
MNLYAWSWLFLILYIIVMVGFGYVGSRRVIDADDYATARSGYGPFVLSLAFASTAASGATFLGLPGLTYSYGMSTLWIAFLYPLGIYTGILICQRTIGRYGNRIGTRSIPEYLGERYQSEILRISAAVFSLILLFYLAGQLVAGLVMFEMMLGLSQTWALVITTSVLLGYVTLGGAHADILTDGLQGFLMVILAVAIFVMFLLGVGNGGLKPLLENLSAQDLKLLRSFNPSTAITASIWAYVSVTVAHIPLGLLPHIGNKIWALKDERARTRFLILAFVFGIILPAITLGGVLARGVLGDSLIAEGVNGANTALPALFLEIFPTWLAALLGVGILAAVMSTADGLVISTSQVFANDIYRRSIAPRWHQNLDDAVLDRNVLIVSRVITVLTLLGSATLAWFVIDMNVVLLVWVGIGGFTAALAGPLVLGSLWLGVTRTGAISGFWTGAILFVFIHSGLFSSKWFINTKLESFGLWFEFNATSPYSAATMSGLGAVIVTALVSKYTEDLGKEHLSEILGEDI